MQTVEGVLTDPPPYTLVNEYLHDRLNVQYLGWVDQTRNSVPRVRSEAMRGEEGAGRPPRPPRGHAAAGRSAAAGEGSADARRHVRRQGNRRATRAGTAEEGKREPFGRSVAVDTFVMPTVIPAKAGTQADATIVG